MFASFFSTILRGLLNQALSPLEILVEQKIQERLQKDKKREDASEEEEERCCSSTTKDPLKKIKTSGSSAPAPTVPCPLQPETSNEPDPSTSTCITTSSLDATVPTTSPPSAEPTSTSSTSTSTGVSSVEATVTTPTAAPPDPPPTTTTVADDTSEAAPAYEVPFDSIIKYSFSSEEFIGLEDQIECIREKVLLPFANIDAFSALGILPPVGILAQDSSYSGGLFPKFGLALAYELLKIRPEDKVRVFERKKTERFSKYSGEAGKYMTEIFSTAAAHDGPSVIILDEMHTLFFCTILCKYDSYYTIPLLTAMENAKQGRVFVLASVNDLTKVPENFKTKKMFELELPSVKPLGVPLRLQCLKESTSSWKNKPCPTLLQAVAEQTEDCSREGIKWICVEVVKQAIRKAREESEEKDKCCKFCKGSPNRLKVEQGILDNINPSLEEWQGCIETRKNMDKNTAGATASSSAPTATTATIEQKVSITFDDVGGLDEQIGNLRENVIFPMEHKDQLKQWGVSPVRGIIFYGPPGTGKTLLGRALAGELGKLKGGKFSFFYQKSSDCFNLYVGETERRLRALFADAEARKPSMIFFDEIDGLCPSRDNSSTKFYNSIVTTMLGLMDSVSRGEVFVIAATNRLDSIDPAIRRPGRFDKTVPFHLPKKPGRKSILAIHTKSWKHGKGDEVLEEIAEKTEGYSGADLEQLCRQTFVTAMKNHFPQLSNSKTKTKSVEGEGGNSGTPPTPATFDNFLILSNHWDEAMASVKRSTVDEFSNFQTLGRCLPYGVKQLMEGSVARILEKLEPLLRPTEKGAPSLNTFVLWGNGEKILQTIQNFLVPCLTSSKDLSHCVPFTMNNPLLLTPAQISSLFAQVLSPGEDKLGVLIVPGIHKLGEAAQLKTNISIDDFLEKMSALRGERVVVLGTSAVNPDQLAANLGSIFPTHLTQSRSFEMTNPTGKMYAEFLEDTLSEFPTLLEKIEKRFGRKDLTLMLNLKGELELQMETMEMRDADVSSGEMEKVLNKVLDSFENDQVYDAKRKSMYT